jgi:Glycine zipper
MKTFLSAASMVVLMAACSNNKAGTNATDDAKVLSASSETEVAEFKAWKAQKELEEKQKNKTFAYTPVVKKQVAVSKRINTSSTAASVPAKNKGWSKAAKGAAIGAGTGAVAGAIINKRNRAVGAVVGGVVGGGVGYGIGRGMDKKDGRY